MKATMIQKLIGKECKSVYNKINKNRFNNMNNINTVVEDKSFISFLRSQFNNYENYDDLTEFYENIKSKNQMINIEFNKDEWDAVIPNIIAKTFFSQDPFSYAKKIINIKLMEFIYNNAIKNRENENDILSLLYFNLINKDAYYFLENKGLFSDKNAIQIFRNLTSQGEISLKKARQNGYTSFVIDKKLSDELLKDYYNDILFSIMKKHAHKGGIEDLGRFIFLNKNFNKVKNKFMKEYGSLFKTNEDESIDLLTSSLSSLYYNKSKAYQQNANYMIHLMENISNENISRILKDDNFKIKESNEFLFMIPYFVKRGLVHTFDATSQGSVIDNHLTHRFGKLKKAEIQNIYDYYKENGDRSGINTLAKEAFTGHYVRKTEFFTLYEILKSEIDNFDKTGLDKETLINRFFAYGIEELFINKKKPNSLYIDYINVMLKTGVYEKEDLKMKITHKGTDMLIYKGSSTYYKKELLDELKNSLDEIFQSVFNEDFYFRTEKKDVNINQTYGYFKAYMEKEILKNRINELSEFNEIKAIKKNRI